MIAERLRSKLTERGITLYADNSDEQGVAVLQSTLVSYEVTNRVALALLPGSQDECIIHAELIDKHTNNEERGYTLISDYTIDERRLFCYLIRMTRPWRIEFEGAYYSFISR